VNFSTPEKLNHQHVITEFDCSTHELNRFLQKHALLNQISGNSTTYVSCNAGLVAGFYTITLASISHKQAPKKVAEGQPRYPIPVILLARLSVDSQHQVKGLDKGLLKDAILRIMVADITATDAFCYPRILSNLRLMDIYLDKCPKLNVHLFKVKCPDISEKLIFSTFNWC